jgi:RNA polymerase sigma factor for flagellar operon FliA
VFERFAEDARRTVVLAGEEARSFGHRRVGTEHLLLGVLREQGGLAAGVLASLAITVDRVRAEVVRLPGPGEEVTCRVSQFSPRAERVLRLARTEAFSLGREEVRAEHILLALVRRQDCAAARILREFGVGSARIRSEVLCRLDGPLHRPPSPVNRRIDYEVGEEAATLDGSWTRYRATGDERARERLVVTYAPLVKYVAGRMSSGLPARIVESDLISYGLAGLLSAIERFDPSRRINFETYAIARIRGSIIDELRTFEWVPRPVRALARDIERANQKLEAILQRAPTDEEMAVELGVRLDEFHETLLRISRSTIVASDVLWDVSHSSGESVALMDALPDHGERGPCASVGEIRDRIADAIAALPQRETLVIALYYYEKLTLREISEILGLAESRVSQLHTQAVLRLRSKLGRKGA